MSENAYLGNPNLKKVNTPQEFTKEQILEYQKCAGDPLHFMENYVRIVSLDEGLVPFKMYDFQKKLYKLYMIIDLPFVSFLGSQVNQQQQYHTFYTMLCLTLTQT